MISILFVRNRTHYKTLPGALGLDVWDKDRDAMKFDGSNPVVAHPPCRLWSKLRHLSKAPIEEKELARFAVDTVRKNSGVLEHPAESKLWEDKGLPKPDEGVDEFGGWTWEITQSMFGHRARKLTWLYIVGIKPNQLPAFTPEWSLSRKPAMEMGTAERERTPEHLAEYLVKIAGLCSQGNLATELKLEA